MGYGKDPTFIREIKFCISFVVWTYGFGVMMGSCIILAATLEEMKTTTDDRQATWCQSALAKGETVMEETAKKHEPQDGTRKQVAEDLAHLLDSIDTEFVDMEDSVLP